LPRPGPDGLLVCRGAKSGAERRVPLVYVPWGDRVVLVASNGGAPTNPGYATYQHRTTREIPAFVLDPT
jgi:hypothetical protein